MVLEADMPRYRIWPAIWPLFFTHSSRYRYRFFKTSPLFLELPLFSPAKVLYFVFEISKFCCLQMLTTMYLTWSYESGSNLTVITITSDGLKIYQNTVPL